MKQAVRVDDDDRDDDGGIDVAAYIVVAAMCVAFGLLVAAILWLPDLYRWAHGGVL